MPIVKVIRVGEPVVDYHVEPGTTVGDFLAAHGIDANGRALVLNGETATASTLISDNATLLLAPAVKGGVR